MWFTAVVVFNSVNLEPEALRSSTMLYRQLYTMRFTSPVYRGQ